MQEDTTKEQILQWLSQGHTNIDVWQDGELVSMHVPLTPTPNNMVWIEEILRDCRRYE